MKKFGINMFTKSSVGMSMKDLMKRHTFLAFFIVIIFISLLSAAIYLFLPLKIAEKYSDSVVITATGEKRNNAQGSEIRLLYIDIDGLKVSNKNIKTLSGNWNLSKEGEISYLGWRGHNNYGSYSSTITIDVPGGKNRYLVFQGNVWRGIVNVSDEKTTQTVDTFVATTAPERQIRVLISDSHPETLRAMNYDLAIHIIIFSFCFITIAVIVIFFLKAFYLYIENWISINKTYVIMVLISLIYFIIAVYFSGRRSFWADDIAQISVTYNIMNFSELLSDLLKRDLQPPLFAILTSIWLRVMPYGIIWLRLLGELITFMGIILCGLTGKALGSERTGYIATTIAATSFIVTTQCAYAFRPYSLMFFSVIFMTYMYIKRNKELLKWEIKRTIIFGFSMVLVVYSHYFGILACISFFLWDLILIKRKKINWKEILSYMLAFILFIPWFGIAFFHAKKAGWVSNFWVKVPDTIDYFNMYKWLLNSENILKLFFIGSIVLLIYHWKGNSNILTKQVKSQIYNWGAVLFCSIVPISMTFIYSKVINPNGSVFLMRYLSCSLPAMILLCSFAFDWLLYAIIDQNQHEKYQIANIFVFVFYVISLISYTQSIRNFSNAIYQPFEQAADMLKRQNDLYSPNVAVILTYANYETGWQYFITHKGNREGFDFVTRNNFKSYDWDQINKIYLFNVHTDINDSRNLPLKELINKNYKEAYREPDRRVIIYLRK